MTRIWMASLVLAAVAAPAGAQQPMSAPAAGQTISLSAGIKRSWDGIKLNVREGAEKMPDEHYSFKPTPDVRSFGELVGHVAISLYGTCSFVKGETAPVTGDTISKQTTKADLVKSMQGAVEYCDGVYGSATDESVLKLVKGRQNEIVAVNLLWGNVSHTNEHYGNMVTYMRLKGLVPPSTERAQRPRPSGNE